jgi:hypothetical protein
LVPHFQLVLGVRTDNILFFSLEEYEMGMVAVSEIGCNYEGGSKKNFLIFFSSKT